MPDLGLAFKCWLPELALLATQDTTLAASEADLSKRLWEVQEVRRRHAAMATQLRDAIAALGDE